MSVTFNKTLKKVDEDLIDPFIELRTDICPFCKAQKIELFSFNGYPQNYTDAVNAHLMGYDISYDKYEIRTMKCRSCNKQFTIEWTDGFPKPLKSTYKTDMFLRQFAMGI